MCHFLLHNARCSDKMGTPCLFAARFRPARLLEDLYPHVFIVAVDFFEFSFRADTFHPFGGAEPDDEDEQQNHYLYSTG